MFPEKLIVYEVDPLSADPKPPKWLIDFCGYNFKDPFLGVTEEKSFEKSVNEVIEGRLGGLGGKIYTHIIDARDYRENEEIELFVLFFVPNHYKYKKAEISSVTVIVVRAPDISAALGKLKNSTKASWLEKRGVSPDNLPYVYVNIKVALYQKAQIFQSAAG